MQRGGKPQDQKGELRKEGMGLPFFLTAVDNFIQRPYQRRELNLVRALNVESSYISYELWPGLNPSCSEEDVLWSELAG